MGQGSTISDPSEQLLELLTTAYEQANAQPPECSDTDVTDAAMTYGSNSDPEMAEWLAPVKWLTALPREQAVKDPDFFANQNSAVRLTHGYTIRQLRQAFGIDDASSPARH